MLSRRDRLDELLARGGMASVYAGLDLDESTPVAIEMLDARYLGDPDGIARFLHEAKLASRVAHPNVIATRDVSSTPRGLVYLVMELLCGEDLGATLRRRGPLAWPHVRALMLQLCAGLEAVHAAGVVHRDIKPANCFRVIDRRGERLELLDFGIATVVGDTSPDYDGVLGTPEYMAPEQAAGASVDARADIYGAGVLMCKMLTGTTPFEAGSRTTMLTRHIHDAPPSLDSARTPAAIAAIAAVGELSEAPTHDSTWQRLGAMFRGVFH